MYKYQVKEMYVSLKLKRSLKIKDIWYFSGAWNVVKIKFKVNYRRDSDI